MLPNVEKMVGWRSDQGFSDQVIKKYIKVGKSNRKGERIMLKSEAIPDNHIYNKNSRRNGRTHIW